VLTAGIVSVAGGNGEHPSDSSDSLENPELLTTLYGFISE
jgi:hypothetical protein